jgi:hypothetical protein
MRSLRNVLDDAKRRMIIALVTQGSSRRVAARYVACAASTITRTAQRDPEFAAQLARAEQMAEINLLRAINEAAKDPKHWRAAAWILERRNPEDFAARPPQLATSLQISDFVGQIVELLHDDLPPENYHRAMRKLDRWLAEQKAAYQPIVIRPPKQASDDRPLAAGSEPAKVAQLASATDPAPVVQCSPPTEDDPSQGATDTSDDVQHPAATEPSRD